MRYFVLSSPNLTFGRPGEVVDSDRLGMSDEKLDEFVDAGYATEVHGVAAYSTEVPGVVAPADEDLYDPANYSIPDVRKYVDENPDDAERVIAAERDGKNRSGIVNGW